MLKSRRMLASFLIVAIVSSFALAEEAAAPPATRPVDLAICLDTSGSMSGLINAARQKLWDIVNELALAEPAPELRVALLTYGSPEYGAPGYIKIQTELTADLDGVFDKLMALGTSGGDEYVGWVVNDATTQLKWSDRKDALKLIFVAGNESADQAQQTHDFRKTCAAAIAKDIIVNSIYCGNPTDSIAPGWQEVAKLADGNFSSIDQNNGTIVITTPFDAEIAKLGAELNTTYVAYGAKGREGAEKQRRQDANSVQMGAANMASRAVSKAQSTVYNNAKWDLVDAVKQKELELADVKDAELPEAMQKMTLEEREKYVKEMQEKRDELQKQINELADKRRAYIQEEQKKQAKDGNRSLDAAMLEAVRSQAEQKGFAFKENFSEGAEK